MSFLPEPGAAGARDKRGRSKDVDLGPKLHIELSPPSTPPTLLSLLDAFSSLRSDDTGPGVHRHPSKLWGGRVTACDLSPRPCPASVTLPLVSPSWDASLLQLHWPSAAPSTAPSTTDTAGCLMEEPAAPSSPPHPPFCLCLSSSPWIHAPCRKPEPPPTGPTPEELLADIKHEATHGRGGKRKPFHGSGPRAARRELRGELSSTTYAGKLRSPRRKDRTEGAGVRSATHLGFFEEVQSLLSLGLSGLFKMRRTEVDAPSGVVRIRHLLENEQSY